MPDDFSKSLGVNVKANFDASGFEKGSDRVIASAERQGTALQALRRSTQELQDLQQAYAKTPDVYAQQRESYRQSGARGASIFSKEAEKLEISRIGYQIKMAGGLPPDTDLGGAEEELEKREISTGRLRRLVEDKFSQFGGMSKTQRKALLGDTQPHVQELQRRYGSTQRFYAEKVREATAEFEGLGNEDQLKNLDAFNQKIQQFEENGRKARIASDELTKSTKKFTEEAGLASKSLPAYAASVINMGVTIGQGVAQITRAGALAFDYSSPMAMYSAQQQFEIQKRKTMWSMGGTTVGQIAGYMMGGFPGSFIGGMIGGQGADFISTLLNIEPEKQLKYMGQMYGKSAEMTGMFAGVQGLEYDLARRSGASPEELHQILMRYNTKERPYGLGQSQVAQIAGQYVSSTGTLNQRGMDKWTGFYTRTGILPTGGGQLTKYTGGDATDLIARIGLQMGLTQGNRNVARYADLGQYFQQATNIAGKLFTNQEDILNATSMTAQLPYTLYGESIKGNKWATTLEGMQQTGQGFAALGQAGGTAQEAFLFNALNNKGGNWRDTLLRMQEGIYGKGNLRDILEYAKTAYGGRRGDALFSLLQGKGINVDVQREMIRQFEANPESLISRIGGGEITAENIYKKIGMSKVGTQAQINAREAINVTESARGMADAFATGLANFNIKVAELAASPDTQKKIQGMFSKVIESVEEAFIGTTVHMEPESQARKDYAKKHPEDPFGFKDTPMAPDWVNKSADTVSIGLPGGKRMILNIHTTVSAGNIIPTSHTTSVSPR
jgi:hypothetical protein